MFKALLNFRDEYRQFCVTLFECTAEIDRMRELMKADDVIIAKSQARTKELMKEIEAMRAKDERCWKKL